MSVLDRFITARNLKDDGPAISAISATSSQSREQIAQIAEIADGGGSAEVIDFDRAKAKLDIERTEERRGDRRQRVLAMMAEAPETTKYFVESHFDGDQVILSWAIRGVGTFEQTVEREKFDEGKVLELVKSFE